MAENTILPPITIQPMLVFGLRTDVVGNIYYTTKDEVIYPVENVLAIDDFVKRKQKFLRFPEDTDPLIIKISPNRKFIAILEWYHKRNKESYSIIVYELATLKKRRTIPISTDSRGQENKITAMSFTSDSKFLLVLMNLPEEKLYLYFFDKQNTIFEHPIVNPVLKIKAKCIASNPTDPGLIAISGQNVFKIISKSEKDLTESFSMKTANISITSMAWLTSEIVAAGSSKGQLIIFETAEIKMQFHAASIDYFDMLKVTESEEPAVEVDDDDETDDIKNSSYKIIKPPDYEEYEMHVLCMTVFPQGFAYSISNKVYLFKKESKFVFKRICIIDIPITIFPREAYDIVNLDISPSYNSIIVTAMHSQIYFTKFPKTEKIKKMEFKQFGGSLHVDEIIDVSVCMWKPIILTSSKDRTVRIWNYETGKSELVKKYEMDIYVIELNPSGLFAALGFSDQLRIMKIYADDFQVLKTYNFPRCRDIAYSRLGQFMAAAHENLISITSVFNFNVLKILKGHNSYVTTVSWSSDDKTLISAGIEGAIYLWDVETGQRIQEIVEKGVEYVDLKVTLQNPFYIYAVTKMGSLRQLSSNAIIRDIPAPVKVPLLSITLSRSSLVMFIASSDGSLYNVKLPLNEGGGGTFTNFRFFRSGITNVRTNYDNRFLITTSKQGTLVIWAIQNIQNTLSKIDKDLLKCADILVPRKVFMDKIETIEALDLRLQQQVEEFDYQITQKHMFDDRQIEEIHKGYCNAIEELKEQNNEMESKHVNELNEITDLINNLKANHQKDVNDLSEHFSEKMIIEFHKAKNLYNNITKMRDNYEEKLRKSAGCLQDTIEALENNFHKELQKRQELVRQLMQEIGDRQAEFVEYCRQVEMDNEQNLEKSQIEFENKLKKIKSEAFKWKGETGVLKKKYKSRTKETDDFVEDIETLRQELDKYSNQISNHLSIIQDLKMEVSERDFAIAQKEKIIQDDQYKNQELEKYKQVYSHRIAELKAEIEPRERQIKEKRNQIAELERKLENVHSNNIQLEVQLTEIKETYINNENQLILERQRSRYYRNYISQICSDIYKISGLLHRPDVLKNSVNTLFKKYSDNAELKKAILFDSQVQNEFKRQKEFIEHTVDICKKSDEKKKETKIAKDFLEENVMLIDQLNDLRQKFKDSRNTILNMESLLGISYRLNLADFSRQKLKKATTDRTQVQNEHNIQTEMLTTQINLLKAENENLKEQINKMNLNTLGNN